MSWDYLFVQAANGAVIGVIYALIAVGVTLIFSILKIVNFAHGDLYMLGGYCAYYVIEYLGFPPLIAMVVAMGALFVGAIVLVAALLYFMKRTIWGQALDAVSQSRDSAAIVGINARRFNSFAFGIGAALAAAAGALVAPIFSLAPDMGVLPNIHAYVIVILGGMGSVSGSIIAGVLLGESENLFTAFFPDPTRAFAYTNAFGVLVLMVVLIFRPQGLFGRRHLRME